jgi:pyrimidine-nucleoside phosphorylase
MDMLSIIRKKKRGEELSREEIEYMVAEFTRENGVIPDYQMSAFCMAVYFNGMTDAETAALTEAMAHSGDTLDLSRFGTRSVDKHSTGGVGDKTSLIVGPIVAACGGVFAKMSGRGLGHTGGTVDKLESVAGYRTSLTGAEFFAQAERTGIALIGQTGNLTPADKKLYALRDVTETVDSIPLIVSSIMSKKIAAGAHNIVLDVKCGSGAFMKDEESARTLARKMVDIGKVCGRNMAAVITNMDVPLGFAVGNALEVREALDVLLGADIPDLREICIALSAELIAMIHGVRAEEARRMAENAASSGAAYAKAKEWFSAQGGDIEAVLPEAEIKREIYAEKTGYISHMNAEAVGRAACELGAGRKTKNDKIDFAAGIVLRKKTGDFVREGDVLCVLHTSCAEKLGAAETAFRASLEFSAEKPEEKRLVIDVVR